MSPLLLIEMPFKGVNRPSIGLSLLKAAALVAGYRCEIRYANLPFAKRIGFDLYEFIAEEIPQESLFGDLIFRPVIHDRQAASVVALTEEDRRSVEIQGVPGWLWRLLPGLQREATEFVDRLAEELADENHRWIGLSSMFQVLPNVALAKSIKALRPDCKILMGGPCCEGEMGLALHEGYPWLDYICRGEGERFIVQFLDHLATGSPTAAEIPGLVARVGSASVCSGENTERIRDLESLPIPDYHDWVAQIRNYSEDVPQDALWLPLETSRGCWWGQKNHCIFCGLNGENMAFREKSADRAWDEIAECIKYEIKRISLVDLILPHRYFDTLLPRLAESDLGLTMFYEVKSNLSYRQLELLATAGVRLLQPGIESLSTPVLQLMKKGVTGLQNIRVLKWAAELGVDISWNLLYGFPGEDPVEYLMMAGLVPLISHLQPPIGGCRRVRIDRFSPLFFDKSRFGIDALRPIKSYEAVFGLPRERLEKLAYFFEVDADQDGAFDRGGYRELFDEVEEWANRVADCSFTSIDRGDRLLLFDRRAIAPERQVALEGFERAVYSACEQGATARMICGILDAPQTQIAQLLDSLERRHLLLACDGHYLSLAVRMDRWVPKSVPDSVIGSLCHTLHRATLSKRRKYPTERLQTDRGQARADVFEAIAAL